MGFEVNTKPYEPKGITLTDSAYTFIKVNLDSRSRWRNAAESLGVRFGVKGAGCGGYSYVVEYVLVDNGEDHIFDYKGIKIFVDKKSILMIDGMEVNYKDEIMKSGLEFRNPLAGIACGCGESFSMK